MKGVGWGGEGKGVETAWSRLSAPLLVLPLPPPPPPAPRSAPLRLHVPDSGSAADPAAAAGGPAPGTWRSPRAGPRVGWGGRRRVPLFPAPLRGQAAHPGREVPHRAVGSCAGTRLGPGSGAGLAGLAGLPRRARRVPKGQIAGPPVFFLPGRESLRGMSPGSRRVRQESSQLSQFSTLLSPRFALCSNFLFIFAGMGREFAGGILTLVS